MHSAYLIWCILLPYALGTHLGESQSRHEASSHLVNILWNDQPRCSGSIVEHAVVTLASCVYSPNDNIYHDEPKKFQISAGGKQYPVEKILLHPCYGSNDPNDTTYSDIYEIALLIPGKGKELKHGGLQKIQLPEYNESLSKRSVGFLVGMKGKGSLRNLQYSKVEILTRDECDIELEKIFKDNHPGKHFFICAISKNFVTPREESLKSNSSGKEVYSDPMCREMEGTSLYLNNADKKILLGIGGYTQGCGQKKGAGLFVDISKYTCWISDRKWPLDCKIPSKCGEGVDLYGNHPVSGSERILFSATPLYFILSSLLELF